MGMATFSACAVGDGRRRGFVGACASRAHDPVRFSVRKVLYLQRVPDDTLVSAWKAKRPPSDETQCRPLARGK
jgi:hypothetical protein